MGSWAFSHVLLGEGQDPQTVTDWLLGDTLECLDNLFIL